MDMTNILNMQKDFFNKGATLSKDFRLEMLRRLKKELKENEEDLFKCLSSDLSKSELEAYTSELGIIYEEIKFMIKNLKKLMKPQAARTPLGNFPGRSRIFKEPYGVVLIMSPWNYPIQLSLIPLIGAIAAGNCVILKPSAYAQESAKFLERILSNIFPPEFIYTALGGREKNKELLDLPFDYIFFTGGESVGRLVLEKASANLIPVTLELGGKSPCIVDETADIEVSARRIAWGKLMNSGQTCVAPDYLLVHKDVKEALIDGLAKYAHAMFGENPCDNMKYPKIINEKHLNRLLNLIDQEDLIYGGKCNKEAQKLSFTMVRGNWDSKIMKNEIFGPILPVIEFSDINEVMIKIKERPKPLALYYFTNNKIRRNRIIKEISYGGGCINDTLVHLASNKMPFGGIGASGMGAYHGKYSFDTFSHEKSILERGTWIDPPIRYAPETERKLKLLKKILK